MKLKTKDGLGIGFPQTDLQRNNQILLALVIIMFIWTLIGLWLIYYIMENNVINNIVAACV